MKRLYVYADFDWLDEAELMGELTCDTVRGNETYGFSFAREWLAQHGDIFICAIIPVFSTQALKKIFFPVSPMRFPTVGGEHCLTVASK